MTEDIKKHIVNYLPKETTYLTENDFVFLTPDTIWEGQFNGKSFVVVAEDRWPSGLDGLFLAVTEDGSVYKGDLGDQSLIQYCAASFRQFMEIMIAYHDVLKTHESPNVDDEEGLQHCQEEEEFLRQTINQIDSTALRDDETFWSVWIEPIGYGF